jgi:hypothetical protein
MLNKDLKDLSLKELREKETKLLSEIVIISEERKKLANINYELCDKLGANASKELEDEMEAKMWAQECIHTELAHQLSLVRIWISKFYK